jgi:alkyl hydroperoxide reductase subunit AhpF
MRLEIYIADHCDNCQEALRQAEIARTVAGVEVRVINIDTTTDPVPARIIATPTYVLDGRIFSLGNPRREDLLHMLDRPRVDVREEALE